MTADYDRLLDPPDDCLCEDHGRPQPCSDCRDEARVEWEESRRKGELDTDEPLLNRAVRYR